MSEFTWRSHCNRPPGEVWEWMARPGAFERLASPWQPVRVIDPGHGLAEGSTVVLEVPTPLGRRRWHARHRDVRPGEGFVDEQVAGPFRRWTHTHRLRADGAGGTVIEDHIAYAAPWPAALFRGYIRRSLERAFAFRAERLAADLAGPNPLPARSLRVAITGASGLVGRRLVARLTTLGHEVVRLVRRAAAAADELRWDPERGDAGLSPLEGFDAVVHLAGENVAQRWTRRAKTAIRESRVAGTANLVGSLSRLRVPPKAFISASAVGWYGDASDRDCDETAPAGDGFLAGVCRDWEAATDTAAGFGARVVTLRIGVVIAADGGAVPKMLTPFKLGVGGVVGSGRQAVPWIAGDDLVEILVRALAEESMAGVVNAVAPQTATNRDLTKALGRVLRRPTIAPLPAFVAGLVFGEMGREMLCKGARVVPGILRAAGHRFRFPTLESALRSELGRPAAPPQPAPPQAPVRAPHEAATA